jgi:hypothetical protein
MFYLLVTLAVYGVYRISREIIGSRAHLKEEEIRDYKYKRRSLSESFQRRITNHIGTCEECREQFTKIMSE